MRIQMLGLISVMFTSASASGQWVLDGDLDDLEPGTHPNCGEPAGAWGWPANYPEALCETVPTQFEITTAPGIEDGAAGNALHHNVDLEDGQQNNNIHLANQFQATIHAEDHPLVIVEFDMWVSEAGKSGGHVYVSGDHGGLGYSSQSDRGPQMAWRSNGILTVPPQAPGDCPVIALEEYPVATWQTVRLEIDLEADRWDIWWAERGDPLIELVSDLRFVNQLELDHLDRFTYVHFAGGGAGCFPGGGSTHSYLDNVKVSTCPSDTNLDGAVDVTDLVAVVLAWGSDDPAADINSDGTVDVTDLVEVVLNWGPCF